MPEEIPPKIKIGRKIKEMPYVRNVNHFLIQLAWPLVSILLVFKSMLKQNAKGKRGKGRQGSGKGIDSGKGR